MKNMLYPIFELITPTSDYAILHYTGCGVMEDPQIDIGYICESNSYSTLRGLSERLQIAYNGFYDNHQSWQNYNFKVVSKSQYK